LAALRRIAVAPFAAERQWSFAALESLSVMQRREACCLWTPPWGPAAV